ncbi:MAG: aminopeptidase [Bacteroidetes bacterium]|nr:aminopeptidase [Bacteroidota bacterium]
MKLFQIVIFACSCLLFFSEITAQYDFTMVKDIECTSVKNQQRTGTCWSFATVSFLESELLRMGKENYDLSEMYIVRNIYRDKARNYILRQGKANFSQGSLAHDMIRAFKHHGIVPETVYSGKYKTDTHDHGEMESALKGLLDGVLKRKRLSQKWSLAFEGVLDAYLGEVPESFSHKGKSFTSESFAKTLGLNPDDYISITSYLHHPFYDNFILEIPDNYSNGGFYNLPIDEFQAVVDNAVNKGFTIAWDGDVSEKTFNHGKGMAILPEKADRDDLYKNPGKEIEISQTLRQETFESYATTDDHLMHLTGIAKDKDGTKYYLIKNSWGDSSKLKGFLYMSSAYFRLKTLFVMVHKDAVPKDIAAKLKL